MLLTQFTYYNHCFALYAELFNQTIFLILSSHSLFLNGLCALGKIAPKNDNYY